MGNRGDCSHDKSVPEKGEDGGKNESPGPKRRDISPTPQVPGEAETAKEVLGGEGPAEKKRERKDDAGASSSGVEKKRKKEELFEILSKSPSCYLCGKKFQSWKGVFGHLRMHKIGEERVRGAFPPPVFSPPGSPQREGQRYLQKQLAPTLLSIAQNILQGPPGVSSGRLNIDLNQQPLHHERSSTSSPSSLKKDGCRKLDLNKPPPPEDGDSDGGAGSA